MRTPYYIFDVDKLNQRIHYLKEHLSHPLVFAIKANPFLAGVTIDSVERYEICSYGEFRICEQAGVPYEKMVISGVNKDNELFEAIIDKKVARITIESMTQYEQLMTYPSDRKYPLLLRLTSGNQFGMTEDEIRDIISRRDPFCEIKGIEYFSGTQKHSLKKVQKEIHLIHEFIDSLPISIEEVEYGPGLPVYYFKDDFDEDAFLDDMNNILEELSMPVYIETGRSLTASCGEYVTTVVDMKRNRNGSFAIVDGGINHLTYYGGMMGMKIPKLSVTPLREGKEEVWTICGSLCSINDILIKQLPVRQLQIGDQITFYEAGAYAMTEGISLFLSRALPAVYLRKGDHLLLERSHLQTYLINSKGELYNG